MNKTFFFLLQCFSLLLMGAGARCAVPDADPTFLAAADAADPNGLKSSEEDTAAPSPMPAWWPPAELLPGTAPTPETAPNMGAGNIVTDGTSGAPAVQWRPSAHGWETEAAGAAGVSPAFQEQQPLQPDQLSGPGTPKWRVIGFVSQKTTFDDNIFISHFQKQSDVYFSIAPGFAAGWGDISSALSTNTVAFSDQYVQSQAPIKQPLEGDFAYVTYTANATHFLSHDSQDSVDQDGSITAHWDFSKVVFGLSAGVETLSGPDIDVGTRTRRTLFTLDATATYKLSDKTTLDFAGDGTVREYATALSSSEWHGQVFADYQLFPKTAFGAGVVAGVRTLQTTPDQYYQQALLRATYNPTGKLSLRLNGGIEIDEAGGSTQLNPVFGLGATFTLDEADDISLDASRSTSSSPVTTGETAESTSVDLELRRRVYGNLSMSCSVGYQHQDFYANGLSTLTRTDNYLFVRPSLDYSLANWAQIELAYEYHRDVSTQQSFDFGENILSLLFNFAF
jgi:hypothetical protein